MRTKLGLRLMAATVLCATAGAGSVAAQPASPPAAPPPRAEAAVNHPWLTCPDPAIKGQSYYPKRARDLGKAGSADIQCRISAAGRPEACVWISESQPDFGFGDAAEKLGCLLKVKSEAAPAGLFRTTIRFNLK